MRTNRVQRASYASMGPSTAVDGDQRPIDRRGQEDQWLQWGRRLLSTETALSCSARFKYPRFNGAVDCCRRRRPNDKPNIHLLSMLQWGRRLLSTETFA